MDIDSDRRDASTAQMGSNTASIVSVRREGKALAREDARQESRLAGHLFRLVRSGQLQRARQVAADTAQPWRATCLAGAGAFGPLPLGPAALDADGATEYEAVAAEQEHGTAASRALWKWACFQARAAEKWCD